MSSQIVTGPSFVSLTFMSAPKLPGGKYDIAAGVAQAVEALDNVGWEETELLVIGSSVYGPLLKVFIGSNSGRLVRLAPVPRVVLPRWIA